MLALVGMAAAFRHATHGIRMGALRFLTLLNILLWTAYSYIPYKTPWLMLTPLLALILLAGIGALVLWQYFSRWHLRLVLVVLFAAGLANLEWQSYMANFRFAADQDNPYVYVHTSPDILAMVERVQSISSGGAGTRWHAHSRDIAPWPLAAAMVSAALPQRRLLGWDVRFGSHDSLDAYNTAIIITSPELTPLIEKTPHIAYKQEYYGMRPQVLLAVYIRQDLWDRLLESHKGIPATSNK